MNDFTRVTIDLAGDLMEGWLYHLMTNKQKGLKATDDNKVVVQYSVHMMENGYFTFYVYCQLWGGKYDTLYDYASSVEMKVRDGLYLHPLEYAGVQNALANRLLLVAQGNYDYVVCKTQGDMDDRKDQWECDPYGR